MKTEMRYLLAEAAGYPLAIAAVKTLRIWGLDEPTPEAYRDLPSVDLRQLLGGAGDGVAGDSENGVVIAVEDAEAARLLILDRIGLFVGFAEDDFVALPGVFAFATRFFDAACRREIDGGHPLRLRLTAEAAAT